MCQVFVEPCKGNESLFLYLVLFAETEHGVAKAILRSVIDFRRDPWPKVSSNAKDLIKKMLHPDPKRRLTAQQVLGIIISLSNAIVFLSSHHMKISVLRLKSSFWFYRSSVDTEW